MFRASWQRQTGRFVKKWDVTNLQSTCMWPATRHHFSSAVASKGGSTSPTAVWDPAGFSVWKAGVFLSCQRPLGIEGQDAIGKIRTGMSPVGVSASSTLFLCFLWRDDYNVSEEKAFLGPDYKCDYWDAAPRHTKALRSPLSVGSQFPQPCVKPLVWRIPRNSGPHPRQRLEILAARPETTWQLS